MSEGIRKTKAQYEAEIQKLEQEVLHYKEEWKREYNERLNGYAERNVISQEDHEKLRDKYFELRKLFEAQSAELESLKARHRHNERGAGRKTKVTLEIAQQVKAMRQSGVTYSDIAASLDLAVGTVHKAVNS